MTLLIKAEELRGLIDLHDALDAVELAYRTSVATPQLTSVHTRLFHEGRRATIHPGGAISDQAVGLFAHFERLDAGVASQDYTGIGRRFYAMYDSETAELAAIILGSLPLFPFDEALAFGTETAITSGVGTRLLARPDARVAAIIGTGRQARRHLYTLTRQFELTEVRVYSRSSENVDRFVKECSSWTDIPLTPVRSDRDAVYGADIIICATASNVPVMDGNDLAEGGHVTSIVNGNRLAVAPSEPPRFRRELDDATLARADVICAVLKAQAQKDEQGDLFEPVTKGITSWDSIVNLGDVLAGKSPGRLHPGQISVFKQNSDQGVGFMALARLAYTIARRNGIGTEV